MGKEEVDGLVEARRTAEATFVEPRRAPNVMSHEDARGEAARAVERTSEGRLLGRAQRRSHGLTAPPIDWEAWGREALHHALVDAVERGLPRVPVPCPSCTAFSLDREEPNQIDHGGIECSRCGWRADV